MEIDDIVSINGKSGLYKVVAESRSGLIVQSLTDNKRIPVFSTYQVSALKDISIYTETKDVPLEEVFDKILDKYDGKKAISHKSDNKELIEDFKTVLPDYDQERVYTSDIKKVYNWYNVLQKAGLVKKSVKKSDKKEGDSAEKSDKKEAKPKAKKATAKKPSAKGSKPTSKPAKSATKKTGVTKKG